jgi:hypothetical protein
MWDTRANTIRLLDSLVRRGLATKDDDGTYRTQGHPMSEITPDRIDLARRYTLALLRGHMSVEAPANAALIGGHIEALLSQWQALDASTAEVESLRAERDRLMAVIGDEMAENLEIFALMGIMPQIEAGQPSCAVLKQAIAQLTAERDKALDMLDVWHTRAEAHRTAHELTKTALTALTAERDEARKHDCEAWRYEGLGCATCNDNETAFRVELRAAAQASVWATALQVVEQERKFAASIGSFNIDFRKGWDHACGAIVSKIREVSARQGQETPHE